MRTTNPRAPHATKSSTSARAQRVMRNKNTKSFSAPYRLSIRLFIGLTVFMLVATTIFVAGFAQEDERPVEVHQRIKKGQRLAPAGQKEVVNEAEINKAEGVEPETSSAILAIASASNYAFATTTSGSLTNMTSGTTQLVGSNLDDTASSVVNIGFDFYFMGVRYTQFSANSNGLMRLGTTAVQGSSPYKPLAQASIPLITPFGSDQRTHTSGKVHFKVVGSAPNRVLVVEWLNMQSDFNSGGTANLTYQARLSETTGIIEYVYGSMTMTAAGAADANSRDPHIGFSSSNTAGTVGSVTAPQSGTPAPTFNGASATPVANLYTAGSIPVLTSATDGSRRTFSFTPPTPTAPTNLTFTAITQTSMTLNWTDSPNEVLYAIYRSTDGVNYIFIANVASDVTSYNATGLTLNTNYFWNVYSISEGALSASPLSGSQSTAAAGNIMSTAVGGNWSLNTTWVGNVVPTANDNVTIADGATVTIDTAANALSLNVATGLVAPTVLQYEVTTARTLTVGTNVTIASNGTFRSALTGTQVLHVLSLGGNLTNNGVLDFSTNTNTAAAGITFTGAASNTFGGTGATTDIRTLTINKGTSNANVLELNPTVFTVQGATTDSATAAYLTLTNGTFKVSGTFTVAFRTFTAAGYTIPATAGFWLNNPNYTVSGQNGSPTNSGLLRLSQGTYNVGTSSGNSISGTTGTYNIEGGTLNVAGRLQLGSSANYTQSGGTVNVSTVGNASASFASFDALSATVLNLSGGTINLVQANTNATPFDWWVDGTINFTGTGTTLNVGTGATATNFTFRLRGNAPNLIINNTTNNKTAQLSAQLNVLGNTTVSPGTTLNLNGFLYVQIGTNFFNNGTLTGTAAGSSLYFLGNGASQLYGGSGVVTAPLVALSVDNADGLTIQIGTLNQIIVTRVNLFLGTITNSNKITLGNGGATSAVTQTGAAGSTDPGGSYDQSPVFNFGTGGYTVIYAQESVGRTTGFEIPATRSITAMTVDNTNHVTLAGGDLTLTATGAALALTNGRFIAGSSNLILSSGTATVTRTSGYVDGNFQKNYTATGTKTFEVGTANAYSPMTANVTTLTTNPSNLTVRAVQGSQPVLNPLKSLQRYWTVTESGDLTATMTFTYLDPLDIAGNEANYRVVKVEDGMASTLLPPQATVNTAANTFTANGVTSFSDWTMAEPDAPTSIEANVGGRILTNNGQPLSGVQVNLLDTQLGQTRTSMTDANGDYQFGSVLTGRDILVTPARQGYTFSPQNQVFSHTGERLNVNFNATADTTQGRAVANDFDGDGKSDLAVFRPSDATWYILQSSNGAMQAIQWGLGSDRIVPADYDGDRKTDVAVFRPSTGTWHIYQSATQTVRSVQWGIEEDIVMPADFDGDGKADLTVFRPSTGAWYILESQTGQMRAINWGTNGDRPVAADYDNDGKADIAVWRPSTATWYIVNSSSNSQRAENWGVSTDRPVTGDFDADGKADLAVFRPENGYWYVLLSGDGGISAKAHGAGADRPVPADYDGDGKTDRAVWQQADGNWLILRSATNASSGQLWGTNGDVPAPSAYVP